jgi:hypothetical protein
MAKMYFADFDLGCADICMVCFTSLRPKMPLKMPATFERFATSLVVRALLRKMLKLNVVIL